MSRRRPTITDVARRAGVSTATVSLAMNERDGVNATTAQHVREIAAELGWRPSARARALSQARAQAVGIIIRRPAELIGVDPFFSNLIAGVESVLSRSEHALLLRVVGDYEQESQAYKTMVAEGRVDGFLITDLEMRDRRHEYLLESGVPALVVGMPPAGHPLPAVGTDERTAARAAVQHLIDLGHRRIGHVAGTAGYIHTRARQAAWRDALRDAGLPPGPLAAGGFSAAGGAAATRELLGRPDRPTAIFYANDLMALAGMSTAAELGFAVPRQLSVVGFDDVELAAHAAPPLTTVGRDTQEWGRRCAAALLALIDGSAIPHRSTLPSHVEPRQSTAPLRLPAADQSGRDTQMALTRRRFLATTGAVTAGALATPGLTATDAAASTPAIRVPRSADLRETGDLQRRWLSMARSRVVLNPLDFNSPLTPLQYTAGPEMPLHLGYYCADTAFNLRSVLSTYRRIAPGSGQVVTSFSDDFDTLGPDWVGDSWVERTILDGTLQLTVTPGGAPAAVTYQSVSVDLDRTPYVEISIASATGSWSLKVNDDTGAGDIALQGDNAQVGTFTYDLKAATGWSGTKKFQLRIFAIGVGEPVRIDQVRILGADAVLAGASESRNSWTPHQLAFGGDYPDGSSCVASDFCYDEETVARIIEPDRNSPTGWVLAGRYSGTPTWNPATRVFTVGAEDYTYAIAVGAHVRQVSYFASQAELEAWSNPSSTAIPDGIWAIEADFGSSAAVAIGMATAAEGAAVAVRRARVPLSGARAAAALCRREREWDALLARVPHPHDFALTTVPVNGVTTEQVRHTYYTAWVFAVANSLPPMPEAGYDYPQLPTGKPSLWVFGAEGAKASAAWESFLGQQFMAYVDPELAWDAFEGLMSLVGADGSLNGESLPSRKAQTAMVLYHLTGDAARLRKVYPELKRLLQWESEHLYWIPPGGTGDPNSRDADFVTELLIDMAYAGDAADVLGMSGDVTAWRAQRAALYEESLQWFWPTPTTQPAEYYDVTTGARDPGAAIWMSTALHLDLLPTGDHLSSLEQRFLAGYDPNGTFCSFLYAKYPDLSYSVYGLLERGMRQEAEVMVNAAARDVARAQMFSENYLEYGFPTPSGVRPSLFGDCTIIDMVWIKNGYRMDGGRPQFVRLTDSAGGIDGIRVRGKRLNVALDPGRGQVVLSGSLAHARIPAPLGKTVGLPTTS